MRGSRQHVGTVARVGVTWLITGLAGCSITGVEPSPTTHNILFIGNSLTESNGLSLIVEAFADSARIQPRVTTTALILDNSDLADQWFGTAPSVIDRGGWDVVVLQQGPSA